MALPSDRLTLLPFPQRWDGAALQLRIVVLPRGNPLQPLMTGVPGVADGPAFADADLRLKALLIPGLDALPMPAAVTAQVDVATPAPPGLRALFEEVASLFDIDPALEAATRDPRRPGRQIKKFLPETYRDAFPFSGPRTPFAVTDDSYLCALRNGCRLKKPPGPSPTTKTVWGRILAQALRQPLLAERLALLHIHTMTPPSPDFFDEGGWLYLGLDPASDYADHVAVQPELLSAYAARIPALGTEDRVLFAPVLFPVAAAPPPGDFDEIQAEAAGYDDGFAKILHSKQKTTSDPTALDPEGAPPPIHDTGIQLGWDDEQLVVWQNRQIADAVVETRNAPMGVMGFRVDVREHGTSTWSSLMRAEADLAVGTTSIGHFDGELTVEVAPLQLDNEEDGDYWMPAFFTQWRGGSLVTADSVGLRVSGVSEADAQDSYNPVGAGQVALRYGRSYDFRVRLGDVSGGGPPVDAAPAHPAPAPITTRHFRRHVPPREVSVEGLPETIDPTAPPTELQILRPQLAYPAAVFADIPNAEQRLIAAAEAIQTAAAGGGRGGEPGLPDPDVASAQLRVAVVGLEFDTANVEETPPLREVYTATRPFPSNPDDPLIVQLQYQDISDIDGMSAPASGALPIPTGRDVILTITAIGREDAGLDYFGSQTARVGRSFDVALRRAPFDEGSLFVPDTDAGRLRSLLLQPDEAVTESLLAKLTAEGKGVQAENDPVHRLAAELGLHADGTSLANRSPRRVVFGCSAAIPHTLPPDASVIAFSSKADLVKRWIHVLTIGLDRDWTWRNADLPAFDISRDGTFVGSIALPEAVNPRVCQAAEAAELEPDRATTLLVFFDAVDPKPTPPDFPQETSATYTVTPRFRETPGSEDAPLSLQVDLPIAAPPTQTPALLSAGIALSPYVRADDYSSTETRERMLWLEFDAPPENPRDGYFARVLSYAPDPVLTRGREVEVPPEPPLPIDPEAIRVIVPGESDDRAGLSAMQPLLPTRSPRHFLVPLPPDLTRDSRELFGFFGYELRVGHAVGWSTAQARFGPALRMTGVQHPAPRLQCMTMQVTEGILVSAPFATPVLAGRNLTPHVPASQLWFLLYAQVVQADGQDHRNILLARRRGTFEHKRRRVEVDLTASAQWGRAEVEAMLDAYDLPPDSPLSVLAVELLPELQPPPDPLGADLGEVRILRASPLVRLSSVCIQPPCPV